MEVEITERLNVVGAPFPTGVKAKPRHDIGAERALAYGP
jgi:hypothetical protein